MNLNYFKKVFLILIVAFTFLSLLIFSKIKKSFIILNNEDTLFLPNEIQRRIYELQNPIDCNSNRILVYDTNAYDCSFGCSIHKITTFFFVAFMTNRTFIIKNSKNLDYFKPHVNSRCNHWQLNDNLPVTKGKFLEFLIF